MWVLGIKLKSLGLVTNVICSVTFCVLGEGITEVTILSLCAEVTILSLQIGVTSLLAFFSMWDRSQVKSLAPEMQS